MNKAELIVVRRKLSDVKPNPKNPRAHTQDQLERLQRSLDEYGYAKGSMVVNKDGTLLAGHGVYEAMKAHGVTEADFVEVDLPPGKADAFMIADNRLSDLSMWDEPKLLALTAELEDLGVELESLGFEGDELAEITRGTNAVYEDDFDVDAATDEEPVMQTGDLWLLGEHRVLCGDSMKEKNMERLMDGKKADLVLTDPPYGVSYTDKNAYLNAIGRGNRIQTPIEGDHQSVEDMKALWVIVFGLLYSVARTGCPFYIFSPQGGCLMMMMMISIFQAGWDLRHCLIWVKNNHVLGRSDYNYKHEPILYGWKDTGHKFYGGSGAISVFEYDKPLRNDLHPVMKPIALLANLISNSSLEDEIVVDPFLGSGTTLIAADQLDRVCYGMEIDGHYCDVIARRYVEYKKSSDGVFLERDGKRMAYDEVMNSA